MIHQAAEQHGKGGFQAHKTTAPVQSCARPLVALQVGRLWHTSVVSSASTTKIKHAGTTQQLSLLLWGQLLLFTALLLPLTLSC